MAEINKDDVQIMYWTTSADNPRIRRVKHTPSGALVDFGDQKISEEDALNVLAATVDALAE
jgi:hypothetical protein